MKYTDARIYGAFAIAFAIGVILFSFSNGCAGKGRYDPVSHSYDTNAMADVIVVTAEKTRDTALDIFGAVMEIEYTHKDALKAINPGIHDFCELLRRDSKGWMDKLTLAKTEYQKTRDQGAAVQLNAAIAFLNSQILQANKHLATASTVK